VVGQPVLIDVTTRLALREAILIEEQGWVQLKGKTQEVQVFSVPVGQKV
jgi:class 3 adenylate cyclase